MQDQHRLESGAIDLPEIMTVDELATYLRLNKKTVYEALRNGEIPGVRRIRGTYRIDRSSVLRWLREPSRVPRSLRRNDNER